jgi:Ras-related protein Rab-6A
MWDTAGSERFKSLIPTYLKNAQAIILTFDITNKASFLSLPNWMKEIKDKIPENAYIIVAGNKLDLEAKR